MMLIALDYHLRGELVAQRHIAPPDNLLTADQREHINAGMEVTIISRRGRTDYRREDAPLHPVTRSFIREARS